MVKEILRDLVKFNTIEDKENKEIIEYIEKFLIKQNFKVIKKDKILIMESEGGIDALGFVGHTDTVNISEGWRTNPFSLTEQDGKLYGLGTCDMKGGIACILAAISKISKFKNKLRVVFTYDEEISFSGIKEAREYKFPNTLIIGEPTNNEILLGSKGLIEYKVVFNGKKVHSSTPDKGESAIFKAVEFLNELKDFYEKNIKIVEENVFAVPYTTFNVGIINGGTEINSVADKCEILFDFRTINQNEEKIVAFVNSLVEDYSAQKEILNFVPAFLNKSSFTNTLKTCSFITEASFIEGERIILGPGPVNPHEENEYVTIESLEKCVLQYEEIIKKLCT